MKRTVTFDPDAVFTQADLAREVGISGSAARLWVQRNADEIPEPLFTLRIPRGGMSNDMFMKVWNVTDFTELVRVYRHRKEAWDASRNR